MRHFTLFVLSLRNLACVLHLTVIWPGHISGGLVAPVLDSTDLEGHGLIAEQCTGPIYSRQPGV